MRASNARDFYEFIAKTQPRLHDHLKQQLPPEVLERIEAGVRTDWIPVELDSIYVNTVLDFLGHEKTRDLARRFAVQSLVKSPTMRSLFEGMLRIFGVGIGAFVKIVPNGFRQSYQDAFNLTVERNDPEAKEAVIVFDDIAPEVLRAAYPVLWEGIFLGLYDMARTEPQLTFRVLRGQRRVEATFRW